jgi:hypothetical protein
MSTCAREVAATKSTANHSNRRLAKRSRRKVIQVWSPIKFNFSNAYNWYHSTAMVKAKCNATRNKSQVHASELT